jgi:hypothetical protein
LDVPALGIPALRRQVKQEGSEGIPRKKLKAAIEVGVLLGQGAGMASLAIL